MTELRTTTPYALVAAAETPVRGTKRELLQVSRRLEAELRQHPPAAVAATLQDQRFLTDATRAAYADLAERGAQVRLLARGLQAWLAPGVEGVSLDDDDPLVDEWSVVVPGERPVAFAGTDLGSTDCADDDRTFLYAVSRDPRVAADCARSLGL